MRLRVIAGVTILGIFIAGFVVWQRSRESLPFDKPLQVKEVDLGIAPNTTTEQHAWVRCLYFADFMVKEIDLAEKGAEQISIVPAAAQISPCQRDNVPSEIVIDGWHGYVEGIKTPYLFLSADDGWGLLFSFAAIDARTGKKLFDDAIRGQTPFESIEVQGASLRLSYQRAVQLDCSLFRGQTDGAWKACWEKTRRELQLQAPIPDCTDGSPDNPAQIAYAATVVWDGRQLAATPRDQSAVCGETP
jgi:uncharacterized membrane protein